MVGVSLVGVYCPHSAVRGVDIDSMNIMLHG